MFELTHYGCLVVHWLTSIPSLHQLAPGTLCLLCPTLDWLLLCCYWLVTVDCPYCWYPGRYWPVLHLGSSHLSHQCTLVGCLDLSCIGLALLLTHLPHWLTSVLIAWMVLELTCKTPMLTTLTDLLTIPHWLAPWTSWCCGHWLRTFMTCLTLAFYLYWPVVYLLSLPLQTCSPHSTRGLGLYLCWLFIGHWWPWLVLRWAGTHTDLYYTQWSVNYIFRLG